VAPAFLPAGIKGRQECLPHQFAGEKYYHQAGKNVCPTNLPVKSSVVRQTGMSAPPFLPVKSIIIRQTGMSAPPL
jgi:hypothetical protein